MTDIEWREIDGYGGKYFVSNKGDILSRKNGVDRILKTGKKEGYYKTATLYYNKKGVSLKVHRLVAIYFIPNINNHKVVNHIDENKQNNNASNLEWCSYIYNATSYMKNNPHKRLHWSNCPRSKLDEFKVLTCFTYKDIMANKKIAEIYNVNRSQVDMLFRGKSYKEISKRFV
jgi:hypothetical protein